MVRDANGDIVTTSSIKVTISVSGAIVPVGTTSVTTVDGVATFGDLRINTAGTGYTLTASAPGVESATSNVFSVAPGQLTHLGFLVHPVTAVANTILPMFSVGAAGRIWEHGFF